MTDLAVVLNELHDICKMWYEISLRLQLPVEDLETISSEHKNDQHSLKRVVYVHVCVKLSLPQAYIIYC